MKFERSAPFFNNYGSLAFDGELIYGSFIIGAVFSPALPIDYSSLCVVKVGNLLFGETWRDRFVVEEVSIGSKSLPWRLTCLIVLDSIIEFLAIMLL